MTILPEKFSITHKRETDKELAHSVVHFNGDYVGYFLCDNSKYITADRTWAFDPSQSSGLPVITARTRSSLVTKIRQALGI